MATSVTFLDPIFKTEEKFIKVGKIENTDILIFGEDVGTLIEICFSDGNEFPKSHDGSTIKKDMTLDTISNIVKYEYPLMLQERYQEVSKMIFDCINS